jgi:hypothetical protein
METTKIKIYLEKNADCPPIGLLVGKDKTISLGNRNIATAKGFHVELGEGVKMIAGGLGVNSEGRLVTGAGGAITTAVVIYDIPVTEAGVLANKYPGWVILPKK